MESLKKELEECQFQLNQLDDESVVLKKKYNAISKHMEEKSYQIRTLKLNIKLSALSVDDIPELEKQLEQCMIEERLFWAYDPPYDACLPDHIRHKLDDLRYMITALRSVKT